MDMQTSKQDETYETRFDVDVMILEYFVQTTIHAILRERNINFPQPTNTCESWLEITEVFIYLFGQNHKLPAPSHVKTRIQMLNLANVFFRRFRRSCYLPSRQALRTQRSSNSARAKAWTDSNNQQVLWRESRSSSLPLPALEDNRREMLADLEFSDDSHFDPESTASLLDILPQFMALVDDIPPTLRKNWLDVAHTFMLHSALEQIFVYGEEGSKAVNEAFSWDWRGGTNGEEERKNEKGNPATTEDQMNWEYQRNFFRRLISPKPNLDWIEQISKVRCKYPLIEFESLILKLLKNLGEKLDAPKLMQLENAGLCSLSTSELRELGRI
ncbi:hypothetical protein FQN57_002170 [Myotisia sp. PD_48]|nr:hypothetical protein FQN57_002170 [Myotisia sp. PD_48]